MSWADEVERVIVDEYVVLAQCFPASDQGLERYRALWLESVAEELAPALADPKGAIPLPSPYDRLVEAFVAQRASAAPQKHGPPVVGAAERRGAFMAFLAQVGRL